MSKFYFVKEPDSNDLAASITFELETNSLNVVVEEFERFLLASGFVFPGRHLDLVDEEGT